MYVYFSQLSAWLSQPFSSIAHSTNFLLLSALFLGFIGSVAPCQITANIGSITYFGNRHVQHKNIGAEIVLYVLGKIVVFSMLGLLFWLFGRGISNDSIPFFVFSRKLLGPLFILIGLFLLGWVKLPLSIGFNVSSKLKLLSQRAGGKLNAFLMGAAFSLGFCPTMFWLFFGTLMPIVVASPSGIILPPIFALGTTMPLLVFLALYLGGGLDKFFLKKAKKWGTVLQKIAGILFILLGIADTITYWTL